MGDELSVGKVFKLIRAEVEGFDAPFLGQADGVSTAHFRHSDGFFGQKARHLEVLKERLVGGKFAALRTVVEKCQEALTGLQQSVLRGQNTLGALRESAPFQTLAKVASTFPGAHTNEMGAARLIEIVPTLCLAIVLLGGACLAFGYIARQPSSGENV